MSTAPRPNPADSSVPPPSSTVPGAAPSATTAPDLRAIKAKQQATWATGDFAVIGATLQLVSERLCETADLRAGERVLDVATGHGNTALAAARCFCEVHGVDYVPALLERGRERAAAERLPVQFVEGDAEALPFSDASFDVVLSTFGVMFAPDHERAAAELVRVCRPGGRIVMANWTAAGFVGQLFKTIGRFVPPPAGLRPPALWSDDAHLRALFGSAARSIDITRREFNFRYTSADHYIDVFRTWFGPVHLAFRALDPANQEELASDMRALLERHDRGAGRGLVAAAEYAEVVVTTA